jgi:hypothetical protein
MPTRLRSLRQAARSHTAGREIDNFGAWISFLVVFASVMAVLVVWQNYNDHAYSLARGAHPHIVTTALAEK